MTQAVTAYIGVGSNLGDRRDLIRRAVGALDALDGVSVIARSSLYETEPVGGPPQPKYLNGAVEIECTTSAQQLMVGVLQIETALGRTRQGANLPRTVDLDLLLWDDTVIADAGLAIPHPRMHERWFVLRPLADIAPEARHPVLGLTIQELLEKVETDAR